MNDNIKPMQNPKILFDIINYCIDVQNKGICTCFIDISGHVQMLQVRFYAPYWISDKEASFDQHLYLDEQPDFESFFNNIKSFISSITNPQ